MGWAYKYYDPNSNGHAMLLIGWHTDTQGKTVWHFKNSYGYPAGSEASAFYQIQAPRGDFGDPDLLSGNLTFENFQPPVQHKCTDEDGDGYYWWGTVSGEDIPGFTPQQCGCPSWVLANEEDCDDSNRSLGPYNLTSGSMPLYQCTDNCPDANFNSGIFTLTSSQMTISTPMHFQQSIKVEAGKTLTVNATVWLHPKAFIFVSAGTGTTPGGKLVITTNGKLTSECNKLWKGIRVFGNSTSQSTTQGTVIINGTVEHALIAVKDTTILVANECGAVIQAENAIFSDNGTALQFSKYSNPVSLSVVKNCHFTSHDTLNDGSYPSHFIRLDDLSHPQCLQITGCSFNQTGPNRRITGIRSNNANFFAGTGATQTTFSGLQYGIYATSTLNPGVPLTVNGCSFSDNAKGIYISGVISPQIKGNSMDVPNVNGQNIIWMGNDQFTSYGIFIEGSTGYRIEDNVINGHYAYTSQPQQYGRSSCGIYVKNSMAPYANKIYRNTLSTLNAAIGSFGFNRNGQSEGLEVKCNTFSGNATDIGVYKGTTQLTPNIGIKYQQGVPNTTSPSESAGNIFSNTISGHSYDLNNSGNLFYYYYHLQEAGNPKLKPDAYSINITPTMNQLSHYILGSSCPPLITGNIANINILKSRLKLAKKNIDSLGFIIALKTDGGNTDSVNSAVLFSVPQDAWPLFLDLMAKSPYLSDTVLKSSVEKENVLINSLLRDILVANPQAAKSDSILSLIDDRFIPMPDTMMAEIIEGKDIFGTKELLEINRANWLQVYGETFDQILNVFLTDTLNLNLNDSITNLLNQDFRLSSKYSLAHHLLTMGNFLAAQEVFNNIPLEFSLNGYESEEFQRYTCYFNCLERAVENGEELTFDSLQISSLDSLISTDSNYFFIPSIYARNALLAAGLISYQERPTFDIQEKSCPIEGEPFRMKKSSSRYMKLYPNPAQQFVVLDYQVSPIQSNLAVIILNLDGTVIKNEELIKTHDQKAISLGNIDTGSYLVLLTSNGERIYTQKLTVIR